MKNKDLTIGCVYQKVGNPGTLFWPQSRCNEDNRFNGWFVGYLMQYGHVTDDNCLGDVNAEFQLATPDQIKIMDTEVKDQGWYGITSFMNGPKDNYLIIS